MKSAAKISKDSVRCDICGASPTETDPIYCFGKIRLCRTHGECPELESALKKAQTLITRLEGQTISMTYELITVDFRLMEIVNRQFNDELRLLKHVLALAGKRYSTQEITQICEQFVMECEK